MNKFATGLIIGGIIGGTSLILTLSDKKTHKKIENAASNVTKKVNRILPELS